MNGEPFQGSQKRIVLPFAGAIFLGAFLLFQVQPLIGKYILPWFGGTSFVWITSLLFFQTLLLGGYFYAYVLSKLPIKLQVIIHCLIIFVTFSLLLISFHTRPSPITPGLWEKPNTLLPAVIQVLSILLISVGLPYFLLATTSTLLQKWFSSFSRSKSPYSLYAISNVGSLLGLISYPFFVEPSLTLKDQGTFWSMSFLGICVLLFLCSIYAVFLQVNKTINKQTSAYPHATNRQITLWFIFPAVSSMMLLAATNQMTQAIAPIPFLWLLPLCLYLISFIICFSKKNYYKPTLYSAIFLASSVIILAILIQSIIVSVFWQLILYTFFLFSAFMLCHGELYAKKSHKQQLNMFYLLISLGSVFGALIVAIIAPLYFIGLYWELYLAIYATALIAGLILMTGYSSIPLFTKLFASNKEKNIFVIVIISGFFLVISLMSYYAQKENSLGIWRNFYATLRVTQKKTSQGTLTCLLNGKIIHGCQFKEKNLQQIPLTYYGKDSGVMLAIQSLRKKNKNLHIGIIGLGVGTISAYGEKGDSVTFYELNPEDITIARTQFSYLSHSPAEIFVIPGDGRLSLQEQMKQKGPLKYNLFVIDAFNDDAIPVHLLTKEAFALYRKNIVPNDSIIAIHISTTYVNLSPVIKELAHQFHMSSAIITTPSKGPDLAVSRWALLTNDPELLQTKEIKTNHQDMTKIKDVQLWTDNYSNLFQLLNY